MGRPKIDHSETVCEKCGGKGNYAAKGLCRVCYGAEHFKANNTGEKRLARIEASKKWNREHREQFNRNKNNSYHGISAEPKALNETQCSDCTYVGVLHSKGRCLSCYGKERHKRCYGTYRLTQIAKSHNITIEVYKQLLEQADGKCAICKQERPLVVDHSHTSGAVRNLLCNFCNLALGYIDKMAPEIIAEMLQYKERYK